MHLMETFGFHHCLVQTELTTGTNGAKFNLRRGQGASTRSSQSTSVRPLGQLVEGGGQRGERKPGQHLMINIIVGRNYSRIPSPTLLPAPPGRWRCERRLPAIKTGRKSQVDQFCPLSVVLCGHRSSSAFHSNRSRVCSEDSPSPLRHSQSYRSSSPRCLTLGTMAFLKVSIYLSETSDESAHLRRIRFQLRLEPIPQSGPLLDQAISANKIT